jgi:NhaA family Na+:H+ antiporter
MLYIFSFRNEFIQPYSKNFLKAKEAGGLILIFYTIFSLLVSNSSLQTDYVHFWQTEIAAHSFQHWINDGFMTIFFLFD